MDLDEFYASDERRRQSAEVELGRSWHDARGARYELSWVEDTGEVYVMREPESSMAWSTPFGDWMTASLPDEALTVRVVGHVGSRVELERVLAGWPEAMSAPDSIRWALGALRQAGAQAPGERPGTSGAPCLPRPGHGPA